MLAYRHEHSVASVEHKLASILPRCLLKTVKPLSQSSVKEQDSATDKALVSKHARETDASKGADALIKGLKETFKDLGVGASTATATDTKGGTCQVV